MLLHQGLCRIRIRTLDLRVFSEGDAFPCRSQYLATCPKRKEGIKLTCECGLSYVPESPEDRRVHAVHHDKYLNGLPFPRAVAVPLVASIGSFNVLESTTSLPPAARKPFAELAMLAHANTPSFPAGYYGTNDEADIDRRAYAVLREGRAIALLVVRQDDHAWHVRWVEGELELVSRTADQERRPVLERLWVAAQYRRQGLAASLIRAAADRLRTTRCAMAWEVPFTNAGRELARNVCRIDFYCREIRTRWKRRSRNRTRRRAVDAPRYSTRGSHRIQEEGTYWMAIWTGLHAEKNNRIFRRLFRRKRRGICYPHGVICLFSLQPL